ncbi:MAG: hypothetical protein QGD93_12525 [Actinomycetota bacterium]|nr:hypothetical protein [Actinomycetota bacterium]
MLDNEKRRLRQKRTLLRKKLAKIRDFTRGSVVLMKRRCYRHNCRRCAAGEAHPTWVLTVSTGGKTRTVYLGDRRVEDAKRMVENYHTMQAWIEEVGRINLALLTDKPVPKKGADDE